MPFSLKSCAIAVVALLATLGVPAAAVAMTPPPPPTVTTLPVTDVAGTSATFHAEVVTMGGATTAYFLYGTAPDQLTQSTPPTDLDPGAGKVAFDVPVTRLTRNTKYYVAAVAEDDLWVVDGDAVAFQTVGAPEVRSGTVGDITTKSAMLHLDVATHGQPTTITGSIGRSIASAPPAPGALPSLVAGSGHAFGPLTVSADGDVTIPLAGLDAGGSYYWTATARNASGSDTKSGGPFQTTPLFALPRPETSAAVAPFGSHVTIKGGAGGRAGVRITLNAAPYPFRWPLTAVAGMTTTDAGGFYAFDVVAQSSQAYGVSADGAFPLDYRSVTRVRVSAVVTARLQRAKRHRFAVSGQYQPRTRGWASLFRRGAGRVGVAVAGHGGSFAFAARALRPGKYEVRFTPSPASGYVVGKSAPFTVPRR